MNTRRTFLKALGATSVFPLAVMANESPRKVRIGLIADVHKGLVPDADARLQAFIDKMNAEKADAILQMGDFCVPKPANQGFMDIFNQFKGPKFHVLGNHDTDGGFKPAETLAFWGMKARYYSFDLGGFHFIVLDANDRPAGWKGGYPHSIAKDQVAWLEADLAATNLNTFIFSHQSLERPRCIDNQAEVRAILEAAKNQDGKRKVAACLNGHWHIDHHRMIGGIPYIHINSASYFYMGGEYSHQSLSPELHKKFPIMASTGPYRDPLFTLLEIDPARGRFTLSGSKSSWIGQSPEELKYQSPDVEIAWVKPSISPLDLAL